MADCFTTVSDITARECSLLLGKNPDQVTPNGFDPGIVPDEEQKNARRTAARKIMLNVAGKLLGRQIPSDSLMMLTSGRY